MPRFQLTKPRPSGVKLCTQAIDLIIRPFVPQKFLLIEASCLAPDTDGIFDQLHAAVDSIKLRIQLAALTKEYYKKILNRQTILASRVSPKVVIHSTLITTFGLTKNEYSSAFPNVILLDDLFKDE